jgi:3',5'-cyclic-AMP phosphodiesterase
MRLLTIASNPFFRLRYLNAARRGGTEVCHLSFLRGTVDRLPEGVSALIATADLQGVVADRFTRESTLLGIAVVEALEALASEGSIPALSSCGAVLAGDLFSVPDANRRGGFGDVAPVWRAFSGAFRWVIGVAGNHDDVRGVRNLANAHVLDADLVERDGVTFGGVGLIAGDPNKPGRRLESEQLDRIELVVSEQPELLVLHEGPARGTAFPGSPGVNDALTHARGLTLCGHVHWPTPVAPDDNAVLNVCERVVVLMEPGHDSP